jgi:ATP-binding cassette subfamily B protein
MTTSTQTFDLKRALTPNRLLGLWKMMEGYRLAYVAANLSLGIAALGKTYMYLLLKYFADTIVAKGGSLPAIESITATLIWIALGFVGLAVIEGGFTFLSGSLAAYTAEGIARRLRDYLFDHIQRLTFAYHAQTKTGDLIERSTSDVDSIRRFYAEQAIGMGRIVFIFVINFVALINLNVKLAWASVIIVIPLIFVSVWFFKKVSAAYEKYQEQEAVLSTVLQENLSGVRVVKAFARQKYEMEKFEKENWKKFLRGKEFLTMHALFWPLSDILCGAQMLGGFIYAAWMAIDGEITPGGYIAYVGLVVWLIWPMRNLGRIIVQASTGLVSYSRVMEIVKQEREPLNHAKIEPTDPIRGDLDFDRVSFQYEDGNEAVLSDVTFHVHPGQSVALLGSTGSGKTSLVNLLPRFREYTGGSITLDGAELKDYSREFLRRSIGIVEQEPFLFSRTIRENITYGVGREVPWDEIEAASKAAAIHDLILTFPKGYDTLVGEKGVTLSGGQKQRVTIARTLLKNPRILIFDDSTSAVDTETEAAIREALERLMANRTTFIIAHRIQSVMNADLILVLDKGKVIQMGRHEDLVDQDGMYRQIYDIQTRIESELQVELAEV